MFDFVALEAQEAKQMPVIVQFKAGTSVAARSRILDGFAKQNREVRIKPDSAPAEAAPWCQWPLASEGSGVSWGRGCGIATGAIASCR